jgi:SAM-dependent methyltransferase
MSEAVHAFFSQWEIYRLCIEHNTLHHREVGAILHRELLPQSKPFTFLDLACGDADLTAAALSGTNVRAYTGVDFSAPALASAAERTAALNVPREFHEQDFTRFLSNHRGTFDITYLGLSLHHLQAAEKRRALIDLRRITNTLYLFEPILHSGETRDECLTRWHRTMDGPYDPFPPEARETLWTHVHTSDFPESESTYLGYAREAGFTTAETLFTDTNNFYSLFRFRA